MFLFPYRMVLGLEVALDHHPLVQEKVLAVLAWEGQVSADSLASECRASPSFSSSSGLPTAHI